MTAAQQRSFYFPAWRKAAKVQGWSDKLTGIDLVATRRANWGGPEVDKLYGKLWFVALGLADLDEAEFSTDHLRHACNHLATAGKKRHSADLNNAETNRVVALLHLFTDPDDLDAMHAWLNPEIAAREGMLVQLRSLAPVAYIEAVSRGKFDRADWQHLGTRELSQLLFTIKTRARAKDLAAAH
jgi:hypothetical protein